MMRAHKWWVMSAALVLVTGCGPAIDSVKLAAGEAQYAPGDQVELTLRNESGETVGYNLCLANLQRQIVNAWVGVASESNEACTLVLQSVAPGEEVKASKQLPSPLSAGAYRYRTDVEIDGEQYEVVTPPFQVE